MPDHLRVVTHNVKVGRYPVAVAWGVGRLIRHERPHVVALFEATGYVDLLRARFGARWRVVCDRSDVVLLVRRNLGPFDVQVVGHDQVWTGPKVGITHRGRRHLLVRLGQHTILFVHRVPGGPSGGRGGLNRRAYGVEAELIAYALADAGACVCVGDQNATVDELVDGWRGLGMRPIRTGAKVDHGAERGYKARGRRLDRKYGSDHYPDVYDLELQP